MLAARYKRSLARITPFGLLWCFYSLVYQLLEKGILGDSSIYPSTGNPYNFTLERVVTVSLYAFLAGIMVGIVETFYLNEVFSTKSFGKKLAFKSAIYISFCVAFLVSLTIISNALELETHLLDPMVMNNLTAFFSNFAFISVVIFIASIVVVSLFYAEVSDNLGYGTLLNFLTGKYHQPIEEVRVFMFLDMKASTTIAEQIGHIRYFEMLKEYFSDISPPIVKYHGEIYQYVGDEVVISWELRNGATTFPIDCFFEMKSILREQGDAYESKYGVRPDFKAGLHYGKVTTGEIGIIKKEIIFTGDVLNTTARIQELCKKYQVDLLVSGPLIDLLDLSRQFSIKPLAETALRGRLKKMEVFTVSSTI